MTITHTITQPIRIAGLAVDDDGRGENRGDDRPPLLLLHGMTFDRTTWRGIVAELQRIDPGRRVLAIDLPGHGQSPDQPTYELQDAAGRLHQAVREAGLTAPVMVGHSAGGLLATIYAARYPARGVVNVDQPLENARFAALLRSLADRLRGPEFPAVWRMLYDSFHVELLPAAAQDIVRSTCRPRQEVLLGYWRQVLEQPAAETAAMLDQATDVLRGSGMPYLYLGGSDPDPDYRRWLGQHLPDATLEVWPRTGHFPHLADPHRFAQLLAGTGRWVTASPGQPMTR